IVAQEIQNTPAHTVIVTVSSKRIMPDRVADDTVVYGPASPTPGKALPNAAKNSLVPHVSAKAPKISAEKATPHGPLPKAAANPAAVRFGIPDVMLPHATPGDGLLSIQAPEKLSLKGLNRPQIHAFLKHAR